MATNIEWTDETWNPIVGCSKVSEGCTHCYAERMAVRLKAMGQKQYQEVVNDAGWTGKTAWASWVSPAKPIKWRKPRMIFVCSMSDLFHESTQIMWVDEVMSIIKRCPQHTFQILTKRAERMAEYFETHDVPDNVWLGVTAENQEQADKRIPKLLTINATVRFVSVEPMLERVNLERLNLSAPDAKPPFDGCWMNSLNGSVGRLWGVAGQQKLAWVICGGESGPGARPIHPNWVIGLRDQCLETSVPFFFKQWGDYHPDRVPFRSEAHWISKAQTWLNKTDVCLDATGKKLMCGSDFEKAEYPVTIMRRIGKKLSGQVLDSAEWRQMPSN